MTRNNQSCKTFLSNIASSTVRSFGFILFIASSLVFPTEQLLCFSFLLYLRSHLEKERRMLPALFLLLLELGSHQVRSEHRVSFSQDYNSQLLPPTEVREYRVLSIIGIQTFPSFMSFNIDKVATHIQYSQKLAFHHHHHHPITK